MGGLLYDKVDSSYCSAAELYPGSEGDEEGVMLLHLYISSPLSCHVFLVM